MSDRADESNAAELSDERTNRRYRPDRYHRWSAAILALIIFIFFLIDLVQFLIWKLNHTLAP